MLSSRDNLAMPRPLPRAQGWCCNGVDAPGRCVSLGVALAKEWAVALHRTRAVRVRAQAALGGKVERYCQGR